MRRRYGLPQSPTTSCGGPIARPSGALSSAASVSDYRFPFSCTSSLSMQQQQQHANASIIIAEHRVSLGHCKTQEACTDLQPIRSPICDKPQSPIICCGTGWANLETLHQSFMDVWPRIDSWPYLHLLGNCFDSDNICRS